MGRKPRRGRGDRQAVDRIFGRLFEGVLRDAEALLGFEDPLQAELWASGLLSAWREAWLVEEEDPERVIGQGLVRHARRRPRPASLALVLALGAVGRPVLARPARGATTELRRRGVAPPGWAAEVGRAELVDAWKGGDAYGDQHAYLGAFRHGRRPPHLVVALVDHNLGGRVGPVVKDAFVTDEVGGVLEDWQANPELTLAPIEPDRLAGELREALHNVDLFWGFPEPDTMREARALLDARLRALGGRPPERPEPLSPEEREALVEEFLAGAGEADPFLCSLMVDFRCDYGDGDPLRWSPQLVELFLLDWVPRKVTLDEEETARLPEVLRAFVRHAAGKRGRPDHLVAETLGYLDELVEDYRQAMADPSRWGTAKTLVAAMRSAGVDPGDERAASAWIEEFNARPEEERGAVLRS